MTAMRELKMVSGSSWLVRRAQWCAGRVYNTSVIFDPAGGAAQSIESSTSLMWKEGAVFCESDTITPGERGVVADLLIGTVGMSLLRPPIP